MFRNRVCSAFAEPFKRGDQGTASGLAQVLYGPSFDMNTIRIYIMSPKNCEEVLSTGAKEVMENDGFEIFLVKNKVSEKKDTPLCI